MSASSSFVRRGAAASVLLSLACQGAPAPGDEPQGSALERAAEDGSIAPMAEVVPADTSAEPVPDREEVARLHAAFSAALGPATGLSFAALERQHSPAFLPAHGLDVRAAEHYRGFVEAFELTAAERERLHALGFVVVPARGPGGAGPVDVYYRVFAADLPVFVTADSVLHAWHRSYDELLELTELDVMTRTLTKVLDGMSAALDPADPAQRDARRYLDVARVLLHDDRTVAGDPDVLAPILAAIDAQRPAEIELMGERIEHDFSQLTPRGHYNESPALQQYFKAMMWLGRIELRLYDPRRKAPPNPREEAAARALVAALARSGQQEAFEEIERFYRLHVGRPNALTPADVARLCTKAGAPDCAGPAASAPRMLEQYEAQGSPAYASGSRRPVTSMRLFPQRFAYDAWVTNGTTAPRLPEVGDSARTMASPYDVAFALGSDRALPLLRDEMDEPYAVALPERLHATRQTMHELAPLALDETIYNHWLQALMVVGRTDLDERLPQVLRTAAWHDHRLETLLASWAELRHDTVLVVEQSEASFGCQYPQGYVEPLPELYRQLDQAAAHVVALYEGKGALAGSYAAKTVPGWGAHFRETMQHLARLSEQQLRGEPMSAEDLAFMNDTVDRHADDGYGGTRNYDGWYAALYWNAGWTRLPRKERGLGGTHPHFVGGESEPIVVDVHTDRRRGTVLEVATGHPELMVVVIDQGDDVAVYGGPVSSFYAFERPVEQRMTDQQWERAIHEHALPSRPAFARTYRAD